MCDDVGHFNVTTCPYELVSGELWEAVNYAEDVEHLPVAGGLLDQSRWFLDVRRFLKSEQAFWKASLKLQ